MKTKNKILLAGTAMAALAFGTIAIGQTGQVFQPAQPAYTAFSDPQNVTADLARIEGDFTKEGEDPCHYSVFAPESRRLT